MNDGGKGSAPRPYSVNKKTFDDNWDRIFGRTGVPKEEPNSSDAVDNSDTATNKDIKEK